MMERTREWNDEASARGGEADPGRAPGGGGLGSAQREADAFLAAGQAAIQRVLSGNPEAFLKENVQHGGQ